MTLEDTTCCGVDEISGLERTPVETLLEFCEEKFGWNERDQAFILFTDVVKNGTGRGTELCAYILKHKLGYVVQTRARKNPNSGNTIMVWVWSPRKRELKAWWKKSKPADDDDNY